MSQPTSIRTGLTNEEIKDDFRENLRCGLGRADRFATRYDQYYALALTVRDCVFQRTIESMETYGDANARRNCRTKMSSTFLDASFDPKT